MADLPQIMVEVLLGLSCLVGALGGCVVAVWGAVFWSDRSRLWWLASTGGFLAACALVTAFFLFALIPLVG